MEKSIIITKLDAAKRQLETAIRLYFREEDPVSIHTLACAAYNVIRDINRQQVGSPMLIKDEFIEVWVKPGHEREARNKLNEAENFFKHADRDQLQRIEFNPDASAFMIWDAARGYYRITGAWTPLIWVFWAWFVAANENIIRTEWKEKYAGSAATARSLGKTKFFELLLPLAMGRGPRGRAEETCGG
jgi:hypothetical protein